jgi:hypothetical protein
MLQRCTHQPEIKTARSRVASPPALPDWSRKFHGPIPVQNRKPLVTLRDAATYIAALPKVDQDAAPWQLAAEMLLLLVAEHGGDTMMPRIAMMKALHRNEPRSQSVQRRRRPKSGQNAQRRLSGI